MQIQRPEVKPMKMRTTMPKTGKLVKAYKMSGHEFKKYLLLYGQIKEVRDWEVVEQESKLYAGFWRKYEILCGGLICYIEMHNGEIKSYGYRLED